jgi:hypothetical protein
MERPARSALCVGLVGHPRWAGWSHIGREPAVMASVAQFVGPIHLGLDGLSEARAVSWRQLDRYGPIHPAAEGGGDVGWQSVLRWSPGRCRRRPRGWTRWLNSEYIELTHDPFPAPLRPDHGSGPGTGREADRLAVRLPAMPAAGHQARLDVPDPDATDRPGLLETTWDTDVPAGRPPRHLYRLTGSGRALATELAAAAPTTATATRRSGLKERWQGA